MRELVRAIDTYVESVDLEVTCNLNAAEDAPVQQPPINQPTEGIPSQQADDVDRVPYTDPAI